MAAVLDAARILKASGIQPYCRVRFVFFSGEEQANLGSRAYIKQHGSELDNTRVFLTMDGGSQAPLGLQVNGREVVAAGVKWILPKLMPLGAANISMDAYLDSDNASFMTAGIPSLELGVEEGGYDIRHHSISDTFDKINPHTLSVYTAVLAITAYELAEARKPIARRLTRDEVKGFLRTTTKLDKAQEEQFGPLEE